MARPYQKVLTANPFRNNGAVVVKGGNANLTGTTVNGPNVTAAPFADVVARAPATPYGSQVPKPQSGAEIAAGVDTAGTFQPIAAGNFATMDLTSWLIRGGSAQVTLAGVANTLLNSPAAQRGRKHSIHRKETDRCIHITSWDYATGVATISSVELVSFGDDHAARPSQTTPGELVYLVSGAVPTQANYATKTLWQ